MAGEDDLVGCLDFGKEVVLLDDSEGVATESVMQSIPGESHRVIDPVSDGVGSLDGDDEYVVWILVYEAVVIGGVDFGASQG